MFSCDAAGNRHLVSRFAALQEKRISVKRKVLIIVENAPVPFDPRVWKEAIALRKADYEVTIVCPRRPGCDEGYEFNEGIHIYRHPTPREGNGLFGYVWEYSCALAWEIVYASWVYFRHGFQVIQGCNPPDNIWVVALPFKIRGVKYIFDHHDVCPELYLSKYGKRNLLYKLQSWLEKVTFLCSDVVMSTNDSYREIALQRGRKAPENVFVVRNGPDPSTFKAVRPEPSRKFGQRYLIGYVGNMSTQEGLDILLDAALELKKMGRDDVHFTCVGGGPELQILRRLNKEKGLEHMVTFTGRVSDAELLEILSTADICVNPDRPCLMNSMSTMIKIMEYMALGKPIVQFEGTEGRFSAQESSLYCEADGNHAANLAEKIMWLLDHPEERARMGEFGRKRIENELAWEYSVTNLMAAYEKAFAKRGEKLALQTKYTGS
jgi:glycosyltransferase involved in cell wall biosynthesis